MLYYIVLYYTTLCYTILYYTILYAPVTFPLRHCAQPSGPPTRQSPAKPDGGNGRTGDSPVAHLLGNRRQSIYLYKLIIKKKYKQMYIYIYIYTHIDSYVYTYIYIYIYMHMLYIYIYIMYKTYITVYLYTYTAPQSAGRRPQAPLRVSLAKVERLLQN